MKTLAPSRYAECIKETLKQVTVCKGSKGAMFSENCATCHISSLKIVFNECSSQTLEQFVKWAQNQSRIS